MFSGLGENMGTLVGFFLQLDGALKSFTKNGEGKNICTNLLFSFFYAVDFTVFAVIQFNTDETRLN